MAEIEADEERKRIEREIEEEERLRLEREYREKMKENESLPKKQRRKRQRAQVQLGAIGIKVPIKDREDSRKKGILYADQRKANKSCMPAYVKINRYVSFSSSNRCSDTISNDNNRIIGFGAS